MTSPSETDFSGAFEFGPFRLIPAKGLLLDGDVACPLGSRALDILIALTGELTEPNEVLPLFTDGWAMQALAYVAKTARSPRPHRVSSGTGLAPWQLRRAKEMLQADLSENLSLTNVATACKLSLSHFARSFKISTGFPPHQWLMSVRIELARTLLAKSQTPLVEIAGMCGFADQSHFSRVFGRIVGTRPGAWRRAQMA